MYEYGPYGEAGLSKDDVAEEIHYWSSADEFGWDGESVQIVSRLKDGRWVYIEGACDYTGWDCQAGAEAWYASSEAELLNEMPLEARIRFGYAPAPDVGV